MRKLFIASILVLTFCAVTFAQTSEIPPCPTIEIAGPEGVTLAGETITFTANISENNSISVTYDWTVSDGTIIEGHGTSIIKVATHSGLAGKVITATVEIKGFPAKCKNKNSGEAQIPTNCFFPIDDYENLTFREEKARLANLAYELKENTNFVALIMIYLTEEDTYSSVKNRIDNISKYLTTTQKIPKEKFRFVFLENSVQRTVIYTFPPDVIDDFLDAEKTLEELRPPNQTSQKSRWKH